MLTYNNITSELTVMAQYSETMFMIQFDTNGGTSIAPIIQEYGSDITAPADPSKPGHTFIGWDTAIPETMPAENMTIKAIWTINSYTVTFKDWDGSVLKTQEVDYGSAATAPSVHSRTGYTFTGWDVAFDNIKDDLTVTAEYSINKYTITFDTDGGTSIDPITQDYGSAITAPADPTKPGQTFIGWDTEIPETMPAENMTVTALWTINSYTVTFKDWDGTVLKAQEVEYGSAATAPAEPSRTEYTFIGWDVAFSNITEDLIVTAQYSINQYTVTFNSQRGSSVTSKTADYNTSITAPTAPTRDGYTFGGWYKEAACTNAWSFASDKVTADITLYAKWTINTYAVTFNSQGGSSVTSKTADYNTSITVPTAPTRDGYTFGGWYKEAACTNAWSFASDKVTGNTILYAKWTSNVPSSMTSSVYTINTATGYISRIILQKTVADFILDINEKEYIKVYKGAQEVTGPTLIGTGMQVKIMDGRTAKQTLTAVVTGDINGDGKVTLTDFVQLKAHILSKSTLSGANAKAADINGDGKITLTDFVRIKAHILGKDQIAAQAY